MSRPQLKEIPLDQIDEPDAPARSAEGFGDLEGLALSIRQVGVVEPLVTARHDGRFRVVAGHRRLLAAKMAGLVSVPCVIHESFQVAQEAVMLHENIHRADLNPADEARFFARLLDRVGGDTDALAELVKERREYVEARLELLRGDADVFRALEAGQITIGVAVELNLYEHHPTMIAHLGAAAAGGAKTSVVREWRKQANEFHRLQQTRETNVTAPTVIEETPAPANPFVCFYCQSDEEIHTMKQVYIHGPCLTMLRNALRVRVE